MKGISIYKQNNTKHGKYKYTYCQNTHTLQNPHIHTPTHTHTTYYTITVQDTYLLHGAESFLRS